MQRWSLKLAASCLVGGVLTGPVMGYAAPAPLDITVLQKQYNEAQQEIKRLRQELRQAREEIIRLGQDRDTVREGAGGTSPATPNTMSYRDAITVLTRQIEAGPQQAELYIKRGMVYSHLGEYTSALTDFNRAIDLDSQAASTYNQRGIVHFQLGQSTQAIQDFDHAIEQAPRLGEAYHNRGIVYQSLGNYPKSYSDLRQAADLGLTHAADALRELHSDVRRLQTRLRQVGFQPGPADGVPGTQTVAALQAYQRQQGLPTTGRLDVKTQRALSVYAQDASDPQATSEVLARFVQRPIPPYPVEARQQGWEGKVTLRFEMLTDGTIGEIEVVHSSGHVLLDSAARDTLQTWVHRPTIQDGHAVTQWATLDFEFKLEDNKQPVP